MSVLLLVAIVVGLVFVVVNRPADTPSVQGSAVSETAQPTNDTQESATQAQPRQGESFCGLEAKDMVVPNNALPSSPVEVGDGLLVPGVDGYGPGVTDGISKCFSHNPSGAVLAAANFMTWFSSMQQLDEVSKQLFAEGVNKDRMVAAVKDEWQGQTGSAFTIYGYKYEDRGPDNAMVVLAVAQPFRPGDIVAWPVVLTWQAGDWKVEAPATDSWGEAAIDSLALEGFVEWRP
ncbi:MAG: hypothetical protein Q4D87_01425 [Actinomycetaceae bacterium]|nr:hypothetical protein [Actinomycetaceae bacterium]